MHKEYNKTDYEKVIDKDSPYMPGEIVLGYITDINNDGCPLVSYDSVVSRNNIPAITTHEIKKQDVGRQVALLFAQGNPDKPVIMGLVHSPLDSVINNYSDIRNEQSDEGIHKTSGKIIQENNRLILEGKEEIVLKCGDSSITLTKTGKIMIRGKYLLNRSTGINRILGGSVQIN